jgi:hypothetical protein
VQQNPESLDIIEHLCMTDSAVVSRILAKYDLYDAGIVAHGFVPYMRDYRLLVDRLDDAPLGRFEYLFRGCVEARYSVTLPPIAINFNDALVDAAAPNTPIDAFHWYVGSACVDGGVTLSLESPRAEDWANRLGWPMAEVSIATNVYELVLVFHDLVVQPIAAVQAGSTVDDV